MGICLEKGGHLVDKGAGTSGADTVHPLFQSSGKVDDLGILTAQLDGYIRLGSGRLQSCRHSHHFLNKVNIHGLAQIDGTGAGNFGFQITLAQGLAGLHQQGFQCSLGVGMMAAVIPKEDLVFFIQDHQLHRGRADINTGAIGLHDFPHFQNQKRIPFMAMHTLGIMC